MSRLPILLVMLTVLAAPVRALIAPDDNIFPPAAVAKPFIDFDGRGFIIEGKRTFLASGSMHYCRVPRALWRDRLLKMKRGGFNTVQTYVMWNRTEPHEGKFDFSGDNDLDAYLKLIKRMGMYAVVRPGPYICAEWDSGGFPVWLRFKPGLRLRENEPQFVAAVDRYYERVLPIIARNQIHRGGCVIMTQLENEHPLGWGTMEPNEYFVHLRAKALELGIEVPTFFSGLHHGADPAGFRSWDSIGRKSPWYSTEFWPGWYDLYGALTPRKQTYVARGAWKIIAFGGNGYNFYMLHGGTNFGYTNDDETCSSYDYAAAIGQAGDLRPIYFDFKRANWFARSFQNVLENSERADADYKDFATGDGLTINARRSPAGTIVFLNNPTSDPINAYIPKWNLTVTVQPYEIRPIEIGCEIRPGLTFDSGTARVLRAWTDGDETTIVVDGKAGDHGVLNVKSGDDIWTSNTPFRSRMFSMARRYVGGFHVRIVGVCSDMTDDTWYIDTPEGVATVFKPDYVGDFDLKGADVRLTVERSLDRPDEGLIVRLPSGKYTNVAPHSTPPTLPAAPELSPWTFRRADDEASPKFDDAKWLRSDSPRPMGADGDTSAYAWYRTTVNAPTAGDYTLRFADAGDWITAFVKGARQASSEVHMRFDKPAPRALKVHLNAGKNEIAVFAAHLGRHKLFNYLGPFDTIDAKGISGAVTLCKGEATAGEPVLDWRMRGGIGDPENFDGWRPISGDAPAVPEFFRTDFVAPPSTPNTFVTLRFAVTGLSRGFAWLNGHNLGRYPEKKTPSPGLYLPECWIRSGKNSLAVFDEEGRSPANAKLLVERQASGARFTVRIP